MMLRMSAMCARDTHTAQCTQTQVDWLSGLGGFSWWFFWHDLGERPRISLFVICVSEASRPLLSANRTTRPNPTRVFTWVSPKSLLEVIKTIPACREIVIDYDRGYLSSRDGRYETEAAAA
jgi:hypothetical protein